MNDEDDDEMRDVSRRLESSGLFLFVDALFSAAFNFLLELT